MRDGNFQTAATMIGGLGIGVGLMYLLDPDRGRRRRALIRDQMIHTAHTAEHALGKASRDIGNRARGMMARTQSTLSGLSGRGVSDDVLVARVRSHLGHVVSHPRAICVEARDGRVRLTGAAREHEVDRLIATVLSVPGVIQVEDSLDAYRGSSYAPSLQRGVHQVGEWRGTRRNRSPAMRLITSFAGGALAVYGANRQDALGATLGVMGVGMVAAAAARGNGRSSRASKMSRTSRANGRHPSRSRIAGRYKDENFYYKEMTMADYPRGYRSERYGRRYEEDDERYGRGGREDRGFWDRASDEVRSWFGDEEAERRRMREERDYEYGRGETGRGYRGYGREGQRQGQRGDYEQGYGTYGQTGYGREGYRGDYERGQGRESYSGGYGQSSYGQGGYGGSQEYGREGRYGSQEYGREGRYGMRGAGSEYGRGERGSEYGRSSQSGGYAGGYGERGYSSGSEYGYGQTSGSPYWSYTELWLVPGPYTGRGPSGYRRSDERIMEDVNERLQQHGQIDASYITVSTNEGEVTLSGNVDSRLEKRLAEDVAESCPGVKEVRNNLRVKGREQEQQNQYGQQMGTSQTQPSTQSGTQSEQRSRFTTG